MVSVKPLAEIEVVVSDIAITPFIDGIEVVSCDVVITTYCVMQDPKVMRVVNNAINRFVANHPEYIRQHRDEIENYVLMACWERQEFFDPEKSQSQTFFYRRIHGAIQDWMRKFTPFTRGHYKEKPDLKLYTLNSLTEAPDGSELAIEDCANVTPLAIGGEDTGIDDIETHDLISSAVGGNPRLMKMAAFVVKGYRQREISEIFGCDIHTVAKDIKNIRKRIAAKLEGLAC